MKNSVSKLVAIIVLVVVFTLVYSSNSAFSQPSGANITEGTSSTAPADAPESVQAQAGNVTQLDISGYSVTQTWQGYFGNVTGTITLGDASGSTLYDWSVANPSGEVYASTNSTITWPNIQCFNYTATGTFADDTANAGGTSQFGLNLSQLHSQFNVPEDAADNVNNTFSRIGPGGHRLFYTGSQEFSEGECQSTELYDSNGNQSGIFQEALLYEPDTTSLVFASLLEQDGNGFDGNLYDFQMIVLEDGRSGDTSTTTYYLYIEIE